LLSSPKQIKGEKVMHNIKSKLAIAFVFMFSFVWVAQASSPAVTVVKDQVQRKAYQARVIVTPGGTAFDSQLLQIPAGKRLVIENVSVITRCPEGLRMEVNFYCYIDQNGDGVGDIADITFHRIALTDQGVFDGTAIATANHKVLVFADEQIGTGHFGVVAQARLNGTPGPGLVQAQLTFTGYLEDLSEVQ
jgi:hypothetical protein